MHRFVMASLALLLVLGTRSLAAATIDIQFANANGTPVSDAVVYAVPARPIPVGHKVASIDQKDRTFVPHILPIQTGTWVEFPNSDNIRHQVYSLSPAKRFQLPLYTGKPAFPLQFGTAGVVAIGCNIHEQMNAYIVVVDTPYFAVVEKGAATLPDLEAGQYTVRVWYPEMRKEPKAQNVTLAAGDHPSLSFAPVTN
jgi:plastocyanin